MITITVKNELTEAYKADIWELLRAADHEFVPPLSARESTRQSNLKGSDCECKAGPRSYYEVMIRQRFLLALDGERVTGFLSYIPAHTVEYPVKKERVTADYISTIIVSPACRNQGITRKMYETFLEMDGSALVATRTWSQNHAHIHILESLGFELAERIKDDRGEGIDTVYYQKMRGEK